MLQLAAPFAMLLLQPLGSDAIRLTPQPFKNVPWFEFRLPAFPDITVSEPNAVARETTYTADVISPDPCLDKEMWIKAPANNRDGAAAEEPWLRNREQCGA